MRVAILGCGPSALVSAHAARCHGAGATINIFSIKQKSPIYGAQYLHLPIPFTYASAEQQPRVIRYAMQGDPESYLKKVYGDAWDGAISDDLRDQAHLAWNLRAVYSELWEEYGPSIIDAPLPSDAELRDIAVSTLLREFDLVINTIPRPTLCLHPEQHQFVSTEIWAMGDTPERQIPLPTQEGVIQYNGDSTPAWYRISSIYGFSTVEWPGHIPKPPMQGVARVRKPLSHNCDCFPDVVHLGRMGRWQNGRLVHHVWSDTVEQLILREQAA